MMSTYIETIRAYILDNFLFDENGFSLKNGDSFLKQGILDSTGILELVGWLESEFGIQVEDQELIPDNLDSINLIAAYIERKLS